MRLIGIIRALLTAALASVVGMAVLVAMAGLSAMFLGAFALGAVQAAGQLAFEQLRARLR